MIVPEDMEPVCEGDSRIQAMQQLPLTDSPVKEKSPVVAFVKDEMRLKSKMDGYLWHVIEDLRTELPNEAQLKEITPQLVEQNVISSEDADRMLSQENTVNTFVQSLRDCDSDRFQSLINVLTQCGKYENLVQKLISQERRVMKAFDEQVEDMINTFEKDVPYIFTELMFNISLKLNPIDIEKLIEHFSLGDEAQRKVTRSEHPGFTIMKQMYGKKHLTENHISDFEIACNCIELSYVQTILQEYKAKLASTELSVEARYPRQFLIARHKKFLLFRNNRILSSLVSRKYKLSFKNFVNCSNLVFAVCSTQYLSKFRDDVQSGELANELMPLLLTVVMHENVDSLTLSLDDENFKRTLTSPKEKVDQTQDILTDDFKSYLAQVGLEGQYPLNITLQQVNNIRPWRDPRHSSNIKELPSNFITMLTSLDRRYAFTEHLNIPGGVRDFIYAMLLCSDLFLRQHILEKISACQFAVPIILPSPTGGNPMFLIWALRRITKKWKKGVEYLTMEKHIVSERLFTVSFLRVGHIPASKSVILNNLFGRAQGNASASYFISKREDYAADPFFSKGTLEGHWCIPCNEKYNILNQMTLFLNLRGDANSFPTQVSFASKVSNLVFILTRQVNERKHHEIIKRITKIKAISSKVFVVCLREKSEQKEVLEKREKRKGKREKILVEKDRVEYEVDGEDVLLSKEIAKIIQSNCSSVHPENYSSIESWKQHCQAPDTEISVDENDTNCQNALATVKQFLGDTGKLTVGELKDSLMPLQKEWSRWIQADQKRISQNVNLSVEEQVDRCKNEKKLIRAEQLQKGLSEKMKVFHSMLKICTLHKNGNLLHFFMFYMQDEMRKIVQMECAPLIVEINKIEKDIQLLKQQPKDKETSQRIERLTTRAHEVVHKYSCKHVGFETLMRELGQLFEARSLSLDSDLEHYKTQLIAATAARLLLEGYPLEIIDGENSYVPITWVTGVLNIVKICLTKKHGYDPKVFVLSVIGVQSSGKSTLLNCMFGARFAVRAGRCTRGLFLQMIEVGEEYQSSFGFQYVFVIDTEGLQSPIRTAKNDFKFDNTLATLAMSIVNLSVLNISQETIGSDMLGVLQIAAHALIRMKKVQLVSNCRIVHQRVSDVAAAGENKHSMNVITEALDKAAYAAAQEENVSHAVKKFSDIFHLTDSDNLYIPCLWTGNMSPPNHEYSDAILTIKEIILSLTDPKGRRKCSEFTITKFIFRLKDVWNALREEDFVFNFQNSFNALSYDRFRVEHNRWIATVRTSMVEWELSNKKFRTEANKQSYINRLLEEATMHQKEIDKKIDEYVTSHPDEDEVHRHQNSFKISSETIIKEIQNGIIDNLEKFLNSEKKMAAFPKFIRESQIMLRVEARQKALQLRQQNPSLRLQSSKKTLEKSFQELWDNLRKVLSETFKSMTVSENDIIVACEGSLMSVMNGSQYSVTFQTACSKLGGICKPTKGTRTNEPLTTEKPNEKTSIFPFLRAKKDMEIVNVNQRIARKANASLQAFADDTRHEAFDKNVVQSFFASLLNTLETDIKLSKTFAINKMIEICRDVANISIKKQADYEMKYSLSTLLEEEKDSLKADFFSFFDNTIQTARAAERTYSEILRSAKELVIDALNVNLLKKLRETNCAIDKQYLIGTILSELCRDSNKEGYLEFIQNHEDYIREWLNERVITALTERSSEWIKTITLEKLSTMKEDIAQFLRQTKHTIMANPSHKRDELSSKDIPGSDEQFSSDLSISIDEWQEIFMSNCETIKLNIDLRGLAFSTVYLASFTDKVVNKINSHFVENIMEILLLNECLSKVKAKILISKMTKNPLTELLEQLKGCSEVCPFCKVSCHLQGTHTKHKSLLHCPQGLARFRYEDTNKLITDICTNLVATDCSYKFAKDEKYRPYKDYAKEFPDWDITPISDDQPNDHWQWVMASFDDFFANEYDAQIPSIPYGWKQVTKEDALQCLKRHYNLPN